MAKIGQTAEDALLNALNLRHSTRYEDEYKGKDFEVNGLPVDLTTYIGGKDNCFVFGRTYKLPIRGGFVQIEYGFRTGNAHVQFEQPVLVLGVQISSKQYVQMVADQMAKHWDEIMSIGENLYWERIDELEEGVI